MSLFSMGLRHSHKWRGEKEKIVKVIPLNFLPIDGGGLRWG
jgi:hypothetical protein